MEKPALCHLREDRAVIAALSRLKAAKKHRTATREIPIRVVGKRGVQSRIVIPTARLNRWPFGV